MYRSSRGVCPLSTLHSSPPSPQSNYPSPLTISNPSLPPFLSLQYCEFGSTVKKCREWLESTHPTLVSQIYNTAAIAQAMSALAPTALAKAEKAEQDMQKKALKEEARLEREQAKRLASPVTLKRVERTKRKHVIVVSGLEAFGLDLKKVARELGKKFACGSSVTKASAGGGGSAGGAGGAGGAGAVAEEIVVQGDLSDDILEWIVEKYPQVPVDNIEQVEEKKKKKEG